MLLSSNYYIARSLLHRVNQLECLPFKLCRPQLYQGQSRRIAKVSPTPLTIEVLGNTYKRDSYTNVTPAITSKLDAQLYNKLGHPIHSLKTLIEEYFNDYAHLSSFSPVVPPKKNFDDLSFPLDHPGRSITDSYYINKDFMFRTHTSAHEVEVFAEGFKKWLLTADVYRRDEIDASHYPVFHQMEGARLFSNDKTATKGVLMDENELLAAKLLAEHIELEDNSVVDSDNPYQLNHDPELADLVVRNLKYTISLLLFKLFTGATGASKSNPLKIRWIPAYFPFTTPSYEVEVLFHGKWLEILGCGVVQQRTLTNANIKDEMGWAFGFGLERIAMILYQIPDIRLFWSSDPRFISQFEPGKISAFKPYSKYPACYKDISFWLNDSFHYNDFCDHVRIVAGDLAENVDLIDEFTHPKTKRQSRCFRINYRSMDRVLSNKEVDDIHTAVTSRVANELGVEIR